MPHVDFVFGFPGETTEDRQLSLRLMEKMIEEQGAKIHAHTYLPLPGTPLFHKEPSRLDPHTKNELNRWEGKRNWTAGGRNKRLWPGKLWNGEIRG